MTDLQAIQAVEAGPLIDRDGRVFAVGVMELSTDMRGFSALYVGRSRNKAFFGVVR